MFELEEIMSGGQVAKIKVVGIGGAGGNVINNMIASNIKAVEFVAVNTDAQSLEVSMAQSKVQIGRTITRGLGAGSKPEMGRESALEDREHLVEALEGADMVFITAGMGGGTGTGAAPVVAEIAKSIGALTVAVVTKPFFYEGGRRKANAEHGISELEGRVDTLITIPNDRIAMVVDKGTPLLESFAVANDVLRHAVQGISDVIVVAGLINVDFADVKAIVADAGRAVIGMGIGKGEGGAHEAAKKAIINPLLENNSIDGASGILINITGGLEMALSDVQEAIAPISDSAHEDAKIIVGAVVDPDIKDEIRGTVIATGFKEERMPRVEVPKVKKWKALKEPVNYKGVERVLAKSLDVDQEDPLDIPTFLRRPVQAEAGAPAK
jgi:cell division protein FtsZ